MKDTSITRRIRLLSIAGVAAIALPLAIGGYSQSQYATAAQVDVAAPKTLPSGVVSYAPIVKSVKPAVVTIRVSGREEPTRFSGGDGQPDFGDTPFGDFFRRFFDEPNGQFGNRGPRPGPQHGPRFGRPHPQGLGSGFIISSDGLIATNNHVIDGASEITVVLDDGTELPGKLIGTDPKTDVAVVKVKADKELPFIAWGDSDAILTGDPVLAIGNPFGIGTTVTAGIVSARGRDLHNGPYDDFIQVDAPINRGNSGGPLISMDGKVVGINSAIYSPNGGNVGVGFAIPSDQARDIVSRLIKDGSIERGYIGVRIQPVTKDVADAVGLSKPEGALVADVDDATPAGRAGVKTGDIVTAFGDKPVDSPKALARAVGNVAPGVKSTLTVWRKGKEVVLDITVGKMESTQTASADDNGAPQSSGADVTIPGLGIDLANITQDTRDQLGLSDDVKGVVVSSVDDGEAESRGLAEGDIVVSINQEPVSSVDQAQALIKKAKDDGKKSVLLLVQRKDNKSFVALPFATS